MEEKRTSVTLVEPVTIKVVVTPLFREQLLGDLQTRIDTITEEMQKLAPTATRGPRAVFQNQQTQGDVQQLEQMRQALLTQQKEAARLEDGAEIPYQTVQSQVEIQLGDNFLKKYGTEILLKDWEVVEIRTVTHPFAQGPQP